MLISRQFFLFCVLSLFLLLHASYAAEKEPSIQREVNQYRFIALADFHFDPFLACKKQTPCQVIDKLVSAPVTQWDNILSHYDGSSVKYGQDTNTLLFNIVLRKTSEIAREHQVAFVMVLGDMLGHHYRRQYRRYASIRFKHDYGLFVKKTMSYLTQRISQSFPQIPIYFVVGNNDSYTGDYSIMVQDRFFNDIGELWSQFLKQPKDLSLMISRFKYAGYYAINSASIDRLRIIVLNTNLFSTKARGRNITQAATQQLKWLQTQLAQAQKNQQYVFLLMHIPEGIDIYLTSKQRLMRLFPLWKQEYIDAYEHILSQYSGIISAVYSGHLHTEWSGIVDVHHEQAVNPPAFGIPSVSPFFGHNPGFKLFNCSSSDHKCTGQATYRYILANPLHWQID